MLRADAVELIRDVARPREQLFVHFTSPLESLVVRSRLRPVVGEPVRRQPGPLALPGVLVRLELDLEERDLVAASGAHAITNEPVGIRMLRGGVVEDDNVASGRVEQSVLQQSEQQHAARAASGEFDDMRQRAVLLRSVSELVLLARIVLWRRSSQSFRDGEPGHVTDAVVSRLRPMPARFPAAGSRHRSPRRLNTLLSGLFAQWFSPLRRCEPFWPCFAVDRAMTLSHFVSRRNIIADSSLPRRSDERRWFSA